MMQIETPQPDAIGLCGPGELNKYSAEPLQASANILLLHSLSEQYLARDLRSI